MRTKVRPWMLAYTIASGLLWVLGSVDDFNEHSPAFILWSAVNDFILFMGNLLFSLRRVPAWLGTIWKVMFPLLILNYILIGIYVSQHESVFRNAHSFVLIFTWLIVLVLIAPTFWAHYIIAYGKRPRTTASQPAPL